MHDSLLGFWLVEDRATAKGRTRLLLAEDQGVKRVRILIAGPHQHSALVRKFSSIRERRELNPGQWCLFAPVQPGNEIKFAMFRTKPNVPNKSQV
jgi:hypothetical protein